MFDLLRVGTNVERFALNTISDVKDYLKYEEPQYEKSANASIAQIFKDLDQIDGMTNDELLRKASRDARKGTQDYKDALSKIIKSMKDNKEFVDVMIKKGENVEKEATKTF